MIIIIGWPDHQPIMRATLLDMPGYLMLNFKELFKLTGLPMSPNMSGANLLHMYEFFAWKGLSFILIPPPAAGLVPTVTLGTATTVLEVVLLLGAVLLPLPLRRPASELCLPPGVYVSADLFVLVVIFPSLKVLGPEEVKEECHVDDAAIDQAVRDGVAGDLLLAAGQCPSGHSLNKSKYSIYYPCCQCSKIDSLPDEAKL